MKSAPVILVILAMVLLFGIASAVFRQVFGFKEVVYNLMLPGILLVSAFRIWKIQRNDTQK